MRVLGEEERQWVDVWGACEQQCAPTLARHYCVCVCLV
jgi:hypothetical protein